MASLCALRVGGIQNRRTAKRNASAAPIHRMMMVMLPATVCAMCVGHPFPKMAPCFFTRDAGQAREKRECGCRVAGFKERSVVIGIPFEAGREVREQGGLSTRST